jgi:hypothetical protein
MVYMRWKNHKTPTGPPLRLAVAALPFRIRTAVVAVAMLASALAAVARIVKGMAHCVIAASRLPNSPRSSLALIQAQ